MTLNPIMTAQIAQSTERIAQLDRKCTALEKTVQVKKSEVGGLNAELQELKAADKAWATKLEDKERQLMAAYKELEAEHVKVEKENRILKDSQVILLRH